MRSINLPIPDDMLSEIDEQRGKVPRTVWIRSALASALLSGIAQSVVDPVQIAERATGRKPPLKVPDRSLSRTEVEPRFKK